MGNILVKLKQYNEAIFFLNKALEINSSSASIYGNLGDSYFNEKKYNEAI